ncbi:ABC transporter substrate-binding protein [Gluconobacter kondonii]|uniref:ABC transporter substrate-binding protein n=1 Tax=Gluconobacter TaxID=441 RepID=UPI00201128D4|nr:MULTISPECIES: ABC transporter substrate-binding protein [Gluconobacter]MCP1236759.1 ABC transporter substrate-binding protein [Gluconobacter kondonii]
MNVQTSFDLGHRSLPLNKQASNSQPCRITKNPQDTACRSDISTEHGQYHVPLIQRFRQRVEKNQIIPLLYIVYKIKNESPCVFCYHYIIMYIDIVKGLQVSLKIGVHNANLHLFLASHWPALFNGIAVEFVHYDDGRESARFLTRGEIDICGTGSTPPIIAQANGAEVEYIAASARRPHNGALVTTPTSAIADIRDLQGARIALVDGSFHTYLLARLLDGVGLTLRDVRRVELSPSASLTHLLDGKVDAWIAMSPLLEKAISKNFVKVIAECGDKIPNRSVFWTIRNRKLSASQKEDVLSRLITLGREISADPERAARILTDARTEHVDLNTWSTAIAARDWSIHAADREIADEQQEEADTLLRHGDLSREIAVLDAMRL